MKRPLLAVVFLLLVTPHQVQAACEPNIPGDVSGDCKVDFNDFAILAADWLQSSDMEAEAKWVARYNGPDNGSDGANAIAIDSNDNVYVTGLSTGSGTNTDYATVKYSPDSNEAVWVTRYNGPGNGNDSGYAIAIDGEDNIYVAGRSFGSGTSNDYATIKYSPDSNEAVWVARYNSPGNNEDGASAIAVDSEDNIYVTGWSIGPGTDFDYATIKYSPDSNEAVWVARYNGPGNNSDSARAIAVDSEDSIYVTGWSYGSGTGYDYATIKYSPDSNEPVWVARYNGPANSWDRAYAIAVDSSDNIYVTGSSYGSGPYDDYATIKYSPDSNQPVWVARYDGPVSGDDWAEAIAIDSNDNIYVTGCSTGSGMVYDYATIKYSPDSNEAVWVARYNSPANEPDWARAIAVDSEDNIYVTGLSYGSGTGEDYATVKYSPDSNDPIWVARYNGPGNHNDAAKAIAVDGEDSIYVTGDSYGSGTNDDYATIKYSHGHICTMELKVDLTHDCKVDLYDLGIFCQGWLEVQAACEPNIPGDLTSDCRVSSDDFAILAADWLQSSDMEAETKWVTRYNGPGNDYDWPDALAVDSEDNIYVTGLSCSSGTGEDYATIKYSPDSNEAVWVARYNGPDNNWDGAIAIAADSEDNIYVTGYSVGSGTNYDYATIKYSPDSNEAVWVARYDGPANESDSAEAIAVDSNDNIYVTGESVGSGTGYDYATVKYSPESNEAVWLARYNGPGNDWDTPDAIAVDSEDSIYVTGRSKSSGTGYDYATVKYDEDGSELWVARYNGSGNNDDHASAIAVDSNDNIYVTGYSYGSGTGSDYATIKYSPDSNEAVWVARYNGPGNDSDVAEAIAVDSEGSIYVTGHSYGSGTNSDYATIKYSPDSNEPVWVARYNGPGNDTDVAWAIAVDSEDNIYVTGGSTSSGTSSDYTTIKYSPDSNEAVWVARYTGPGNNSDAAKAIAVDSEDSISVTGYSTGSGTVHDYVTIKYSPGICTMELKGDLTHDCKVDLYDLGIFCQSWLECNLEPPSACW